MAYKVQFRRDTAARWAQYNPVLMDGEIGFISDGRNQFKIGDGIHTWNELELQGFDGTIVHETGDSATSVMSQKAVTENFNRILRDLGLYPTVLSVALSVGKSGKYVNSDGEEAANASMSISAPVQLKAGNIYLFPSSQALGVGVALFTRQVTNTYDKVIVYETLEEDSEGRPVKVQADYDASLVYTITYDDEGNPTYKDSQGGVVESLPATHEVTESFYEPLFRTNDTSMPESGSYLYLCPQDMEIVVSAYTSDIQGKSMTGVRYGAFASLLTNFVNNFQYADICQALAELAADIRGLASVVDNAGHLKVELLDMADLPLVCGEKMYMTGDGAPSSPPTVPFQEYYDSENKKFYKAAGELPNTPTTADWIAIN